MNQKRLSDRVRKTASSEPTNVDSEKTSNEYISITRETVAERNTHERKKERLGIARTAIIYSFYSLIGISLLFILVGVSNIHFKNFDSSQYIYFLSALTGSVFSVLTLALGFVAGSSID